jgi:hypothetical protein
MTLIAFVAAIARPAVHVGARTFARVKGAFWSIAGVIAAARIHRARREAEFYRDRYRVETKDDDDLPVII